MSIDYDKLQVRNNEDEQRYEIRAGHDVAILTYEREGKNIIFLHTGVPPAMEGHGIGNRLAQTALDEAREQGLVVVPLCPFVAAFIRRHPDYLSLVTPSERARLQREE